MSTAEDYVNLTRSLADSFNALANEVQTLADRRTVLEHKLRFAHEQFQYLADRYAPAAPEVAETLTKLQLPPNTSLDPTQSVPLPGRQSSQTQHKLAVVIRDGRRAVNRLASLGDASKTTSSGRDTYSMTSHPVETSMSTALEQDFTVEGKKGDLRCPFQQTRTDQGGEETHQEAANATTSSHQASDAFCAALYEDVGSQSAGPNGTAASRCPIRFLDKHSPKEVAQYVETHKHELPRSHEVCVRRYQRNEEHMRKLDSKYGDIVSMIEGLSQLHKPMMPEDQAGGPSPQNERQDLEHVSNQRVQNWAHDISETTDPDAKEELPSHAEEERQSHFDRPLKEVRVGESPSRPWGISVPVYEPPENGDALLFSPPPAPVRMPEPHQTANTPAKRVGKCPFDHEKLAAMGISRPGADPVAEDSTLPAPPPALEENPFTPRAEHQAKPKPQVHKQPAFISQDAIMAAGNVPQMVFTGPVFIGYPMEQAIQFMNQSQGSHK